jgi:hypothetical protein
MLRMNTCGARLIMGCPAMTVVGKLTVAVTPLGRLTMVAMPPGFPACITGAKVKPGGAANPAGNPAMLMGMPPAVGKFSRLN